MRTRILVCLFAFAALVPRWAPAQDRPLPDAQLEFSGWVGGIGIGYTTLEGTLHTDDGDAYRVTIVGMTAPEVGLVYVDGAAKVYGLDDPRDLEGRYRAFTFSATLGGGAHVILLQNKADVYLEMSSRTFGLGLTGGPSAIRIFVHGLANR